MLRRLVGDADRLVVVDTETTGVYPSDRIVEVATVTMTPDGEIIDRWETLVDPGRDVGPTHIHGVSPRMLADAPSFEDIAGALAVRLAGAVFTAFNVPFDLRMLRGEFERFGITLDTPFGTIDPLQVCRSKLVVACEEHDISLDGAHRASVDADATAQLLLRLANRFVEPAGPAFVAGPLHPSHASVVTRDSVDWRPEDLPPPPLIVFLASRLEHRSAPGRLQPYLDLLDRAVADLHLDRDERVALGALAVDLGLDSVGVGTAHRRFMNDLIDEALDDHVVTDDEYDALLRVAAALGVDDSLVDRRVAAARAATTTVVLEPGMSVCFTGNAMAHTRDELRAMAAEWGLDARSNVVKSLGVLVAADPSSRSGKAKKARGWGIPVASVDDFLGAGARGTIAVEASPLRLRVVECPDCHATTTETYVGGGVKERLCEGCAPLPPTPAPPPTPMGAAPKHRDRPQSRPKSQTFSRTGPANPTFEDLVCGACGVTWTRERRRGRKPTRCPDCDPSLRSVAVTNIDDGRVPLRPPQTHISEESGTPEEASEESATSNGCHAPGISDRKRREIIEMVSRVHPDDRPVLMVRALRLRTPSTSHAVLMHSGDLFLVSDTVRRATNVGRASDAQPVWESARFGRPGHLVVSVGDRKVRLLATEEDASLLLDEAQRGAAQEPG